MDASHRDRVGTGFTALTTESGFPAWSVEIMTATLLMRGSKSPTMCIMPSLQAGKELYRDRSHTSFWMKSEQKRMYDDLL